MDSRLNTRFDRCMLPQTLESQNRTGLGSGKNGSARNRTNILIRPSNDPLGNIVGSSGQLGSWSLSQGNDDSDIKQSLPYTGNTTTETAFSPGKIPTQNRMLDFTLPPMLPDALKTLEREKTRFGSFLSDDSDVAPPVASRVGLRTYSQQLEDYITRFRCPPPDIKFWPYGPYWPRCHEGLILDTPKFLNTVPNNDEPLARRCRDEDESTRTIENQTTPYTSRWRGTLIVYDAERSPREYNPQPVAEGCCPNLVFESRFECGNLRQARRIGMFEYELILKTDLYTQRHTQWYFFRVHNAVPGVTYKFKIVNLLKSDSLYNYGMRPLMYSEREAAEKQTGWVRTGHHISYTKNTNNMASSLLSRVVPYFMLDFQMEFPNAEDTYYLAHCYPYTFTDLKDDLDVLAACPERKACLKREVLCETRAGNSCFLITVTNFNKKEDKKAVVISARVHPGESQASWMMKGLLEFITSSDPVAQELRDKFIFKMVPMLNPDGVIVGNYRCSLAARDLNRNYRHPRRESFPTIYAVKQMMEEVMQKYEITLYCDLHGHSRKHNVFMYGNNTSIDGDSGVGAARAFISERLFPWLMSTTCPDKFSFRSCKFQIRRCKESTGRVVMWRQMNIYNSFTLEATFSGTIVDKDKHRHFNVLDLMDIGRSLAKTVLQYQQVQDNKMKQTETVLDLTKAITQQILESRGLIGPNSQLPDFLIDKNLMETDAAAVQEDAEKWTGAMLSLLQHPPVSDPAISGEGQGQTREKGMRRSAASMASGLSKDEALKLLDRVSMSTMDGCLKVLAALNVRDAVQESDSSDSDSESEPEMKLPETKPRKKKRKSRKQRDRDLHDNKKVNSDHRDERGKELRGKTYSHQTAPKISREREQERERKRSVRLALPALLCAEAAPTNSHGLSSGSLDSSLLTSAQLAKRQAGSNSVLDRLNKERRSSQFQSKYEGRHNGGVPCFTEERSLERAAKRVAEMRKKYEDDKHQREVSVVCVDEQALYGYPNQLYPQVLTQEDFNQRLQVALNEGTANISRTLMGMNVRTSYTHADNLQEIHPSINSSFMLATHLSHLGNNSPANGNTPNGHLSNGVNSYSGHTKAPLSHREADNDNSSTSDNSDSGNEMLKSQSAMPMSSRRSPYYLDILQRSSSSSWPVRPMGAIGSSVGGGTLGAPVGSAGVLGGYQPPLSVLPSAPVTKRPVRYKASHGQGHSQRMLQRHSQAPPIMTSSIQPVSRDPARTYDNGTTSHLASTNSAQAAASPEKPQYERPRLNRGPLIGGWRHPNSNRVQQSQGYSWE